MPQPGSHKYDIKRARLRKRLENEGVAADEAADELANQELQQDPRNRPQRESERGDGRRASAEAQGADREVPWPSVTRSS